MTRISIEPKKMTPIVTILTGWVIGDTYEYNTCREKLLDLAIDEDDVDWLMETVNFKDIENHDMESYLSERIEEYNIHHFDMDDDIYGCGHDRFLSTI